MIMALFLGGCVGLILGVTGSGGAILAVPILIFGLDLSPKVAIPISLMAVALSASIGALSVLKSGHLRYKAASLIAISGIVIAPLGVWLGGLLPNQPLMIIFALALLYIGHKTLFKKERNKTSLLDESIDALPCEINPKRGKLHWTKRCAQSLAFTGSITGFLSGLLGVGGGFVIIPALRKFFKYSYETNYAYVFGCNRHHFNIQSNLIHFNWSINVEYCHSIYIGECCGDVGSKSL